MKALNLKRALQQPANAAGCWIPAFAGMTPQSW